LVSTFFGLTPAYKKIVLEEIFLLCYHSNGGFAHDEVYDMPIRYRRFYLQKINETNQQQQDMMDKKYGNLMNNSETSEPTKKSREPIPIPDFVSKSLKSKAPKK
jgi:hypothetical protein